MQECIDLSLLLKIGQDGTILAHDTLAPVVMREYNVSDKPGQQAARILNSKMADLRILRYSQPDQWNRGGCMGQRQRLLWKINCYRYSTLQEFPSSHPGLPDWELGFYNKIV